MKKKISKQFEYEGLGFPIMLVNVPMINVRGIEVPDIDYNALQKSALLALCEKSSPFTGNEVRFIRQYQQMTYTEFANKFGVTHASVIHWEKAKNCYAKITPSTELCIRLSVLDSLKAKSTVFRGLFRRFDYLKFYKQSKSPQGISAKELISFDSATLTSFH